MGNDSSSCGGNDGGRELSMRDIVNKSGNEIRSSFMDHSSSNNNGYKGLKDNNSYDILSKTRNEIRSIMVNKSINTDNIDKSCGIITKTRDELRSIMLETPKPNDVIKYNDDSNKAYNVFDLSEKKMQSIIIEHAANGFTFNKKISFSHDKTFTENIKENIKLSLDHLTDKGYEDTLELYDHKKYDWIDIDKLVKSGENLSYDVKKFINFIILHYTHDVVFNIPQKIIDKSHMYKNMYEHHTKEKSKNKLKDLDARDNCLKQGDMINQFKKKYYMNEKAKFKSQ